MDAFYVHNVHVDQNIKWGYCSSMGTLHSDTIFNHKNQKQTAHLVIYLFKHLKRKCIFHMDTGNVCIRKV